MLGLLKRVKKLFNQVPHVEFTTKYLWEFEYGDPEGEFVETMQEHILISNQQVGD